MSILGREAKLEAVIMSTLTPNAEQKQKIAGGGAKCEHLIVEGALEH